MKTLIPWKDQLDRRTVKRSHLQDMRDWYKQPQATANQGVTPSWLSWWWAIVCAAGR